jgi:DNA-binding response OmpR family regulator
MAFRPTILIADDEHIITDTLALIFRRSGFVALTAHHLDQLRNLAAAIRPDLVLLDVVFANGQTSLDVAVELREQGIGVLLFSGRIQVADLFEDFRRRGEADFPVLAKPISPQELLAEINKLLPDSASERRILS